MSSLIDARSGGNFKIISLPDGDEKLQLMRMGVCEGDAVSCVQKLPGGTTVIQRNRQEIAIGSALAKKIHISFL